MTPDSAPERPREDLAPVVPLSARESRAGGPDSDDEADAFLARLGAALPPTPVALRLALAVLGVAQLVLVVPWLVDRDPFGLLDDSSPAHLARDGALGLVVAVVALLAVWRPRWALPCFAVGSVTLVAQTVAGVVDNESMGSRGVEIVHLPSIVLTALVAFIAIRLTPLGPRR